MIEKNNVTGIILCKNEGYNLIECINALKSYLNEVIVIDSSNNEIAKKICDELDCKYYHREIGKEGINGFADLRNFGQEVCSNDWLLHVDIDEIFSDIFLKNLDEILKKSDRWVYKFPRINLPFYEKYPDYQVRLCEKNNTEWIGKIHETVSIINKPFEITKLDEYPIIHKKRDDKLLINKRWKNEREIFDVLIVSLVNNSSKWIQRFLTCLSELVTYERSKGNNFSILYIEGNSDDGSYELVSDWIEKENGKLKKEIYSILKMDINSDIQRFEKLAILRNMGIKIGFENKDYDYVLMIDSDIIFEKNLIEKMVRFINGSGYDVVAPFIGIEKFRSFANDYFYDILAFRYKGKNFTHFFPYTMNENEFNINNIVLNMDSVGSCYLVKSEIFNINDFSNFNIEKCYEESKNKVLCLYESNEGRKSEQVCFFESVKKKGYKVAFNRNIRVLHINLEQYGEQWH